jgi:hypothetical protein
MEAWYKHQAKLIIQVSRIQIKGLVKIEMDTALNRINSKLNFKNNSIRYKWKDRVGLS